MRRKLRRMSEIIWPCVKKTPKLPDEESHEVGGWKKEKKTNELGRLHVRRYERERIGQGYKE